MANFPPRYNIHIYPISIVYIPLNIYELCTVHGLWGSVNKGDNYVKLSLDCKLYWFPKFYNHIFLFVGLATLGTFMYFDWIIQ